MPTGGRRRRRRDPRDESWGGAEEEKKSRQNFEKQQRREIHAERWQEVRKKKKIQQLGRLGIVEPESVCSAQISE